MHIVPKIKIYTVLFFGLSSGMVPGADGWAVHASACPPAALSQVRTHRAQPGESLAMVASQYGLQLATLATMNPALADQKSLPPGQVVTVPPFNGVVVQASREETWQSLAERHGSRADLLFEVNGCPPTLPEQVFIPGGNAQIAAVSPVTLGYPLSVTVPLALSYGWQPHPQRDELVFNSGIALATPAGTEVIAADDGIVAFVGDRNGTLMVVINHQDGLQTRYGNLASATLTVGDVVGQGNVLGTVAGDPNNSFVYFEVRTNSNEGWVARDPGLYLSELELKQ